MRRCMVSASHVSCSQSHNTFDPYFQANTVLCFAFVVAHLCMKGFLFSLPFFSKPATHSGQVSGQQRAKESEAALGGGPQASLQPGVPGSDRHPAAGPGHGPE